MSSSDLLVKGFFQSLTAGAQSFFVLLAQVAYNSFLHGLKIGCGYTAPQVASWLEEQERKRVSISGERALSLENWPYFRTESFLFPLALLSSMIGGIIGVSVVPLVYYIIEPIVIHFCQTFIIVINASVKDMYSRNKQSKTTFQLIPENLFFDEQHSKRPTAGFIGVILGAALGFPIYLTLVAGRILWNTLEHTFRNFCRGVRVMLPKETYLYKKFILPKDKRAKDGSDYGLSYALGVLGIFPLGLAAAIVGIVVGGLLCLGSLGVSVFFGKARRNDTSENKIDALEEIEPLLGHEQDPSSAKTNNNSLTPTSSIKDLPLIKNRGKQQISSVTKDNNSSTDATNAKEEPLQQPMKKQKTRFFNEATDSSDATESQNPTVPARSSY